jgi:hypothetical protein
MILLMAQAPNRGWTTDHCSFLLGDYSLKEADP